MKIAACQVRSARVRNHVSIPIGRNATPAVFYSFHDLCEPLDHFLVAFAAPAHSDDPPLVRIHSECITGDVFGSRRCDCGPQLEEAIRYLSAIGGYLIYLRQEGRGIGLYPKIDAYALQDEGVDTFEANLRLAFPEDSRSYVAAAQMLLALGIGQIRLLTNNPGKVDQLVNFGIATERVPTGVFETSENATYLRSKASKGGHLINFPTSVEEDPSHD